MKVTVLNNQSLLDLSIQHTGSAAAVIEIALLNDIAPSQPLSFGMVIEIPDDLIIDKGVVDYLRMRQHPPIATQGIKEIEIKPLAGINYWKIGETFEVQ